MDQGCAESKGEILNRPRPFFASEQCLLVAVDDYEVNVAFAARSRRSVLVRLSSYDERCQPTFMRESSTRNISESWWIPPD